MAIESATIGIGLEEFWRLSLRELWMVRAAARERSRQDYERDTVLAWQVVNIYVMTQNDKRVPDLRRLLRRPGERQTPQEQRAILHQLAATYGLPLRVVTHASD